MSVTAADGFRAAGVAAGIKKRGLDLAVVAAAGAVPTAGVFTTNRAAAAPVRLSRDRLGADPVARAVVLNSGCANAATGVAGEEAAGSTALAAAEALGCPAGQVLVCSTGTIGTFLPVDAVRAGVRDAVAHLGDGRDDGRAAATAIMTTDSVPKEAVHAGTGFVVGGMAKGAGMIRPDMATMLAVLTTDAVAEASLLTAALREAVDRSFNALNVDGCPSTNDTVLVLASGASGVAPSREQLTGALTSVCADLAEQIGRDAEGASRLVTIEVTGAPDDAFARHIGRAAADSALVRSAFHGGDANWGRIVAALGATDLPVDYDVLTIAFGGVTVAAGCVAVDHDGAGLGDLLAVGDFTVVLTVGHGPGRARVLTTDLTPEYVHFNAERS